MEIPYIGYEIHSCRKTASSMKASFINCLSFFLGTCAILLSSCENVEPMTISNQCFSLDLWSDWKFEEEQGIDSYVGVYTNGDDEIKVDCGGYFALNSLDNILETPETTYFEETIIDGQPAKIRKIEPADQSSSLSLYILLEGNTAGSRLTVTNSSDDAKYIAIFRTLKFP
jgi:hypothetical protein